MASEQSSLVDQQKTKKVIKLVPPDGGWGWMVVTGVAISNIFNNSLVNMFGFIYGDALEDMGYKTSGVAFVMSTLLFVGCFAGPIGGALIKISSPRFVAVTGSCFCTAGIFLTGFSTNIVHMTLSFGLVLGLGLGFILNSTFVGINSYFKLRKSRAVGLGYVGTGVGHALMPHIARYFLENYGFRGGCMLLASLSLHGVAGTLLMQPVSWHMKKVEEEVVIDEKLHLLPENKHKNIVLRKNSIADELQETNIDKEVKKQSLNSEKPNVFDDKITQCLNEPRVSKDNPDCKLINGNNVVTPSPEQKSWWRKLFDLFDFSLLTSPRFVSVIFGSTLAVTSVQNFSMIYPLFLQKSANLNSHETAMCMSVAAFSDIIGRLTLPAIQDKYRIGARWMITMTSICLVIGRQVLAYQTKLSYILVLAVVNGFTKSMLVVGRNLAISENCRLDQVPAAVGLGMMSSGFVIPPVGYLLGWIRDYTDSYVVCLTSQNVLLIILLIIWLPDLIYLKLQERKRNARLKEIELQQI